MRLELTVEEAEKMLDDYRVLVRRLLQERDEARAVARAMLRENIDWISGGTFREELKQYPWLKEES